MLISYIPPSSPVNPDLEDDPPLRVVVGEVVVGRLQGLQQPGERPGPVVGQHQDPEVARFSGQNIFRILREFEGKFILI